MTPIRDAFLIENGPAKPREIYITLHTSAGVKLRKVVVVSTKQ